MTVIKQKLTPKSNLKYVSYKEAKVGDLLVEGELVEVKYVKPFSPVNAKGQPNADVPNYTFQTDEGLVVLNSTADLVKIFKDYNIGVGDLLEIVYLGKEKRKNKEGVPYLAHTFDVSASITEPKTA